jgi:glutamyl-tRNA synthetase
MSLVSRYAPSPSGPLHLGNLRSALFAWLQARWSGAIFILRMDDLDALRTLPGMAEQALEDLNWLGIDWDRGPNTDQGVVSVKDTCGPYTQSDCDDHYQQVFDQLRQTGHLYKCICSRKEWQAVVSAPHGEASLYPGTCRNPSIAQQQRIDSGKQFSWRFRVDDRVIRFVDEILGETKQNLAVDVGDFIVRRADGLFAYHLATVVDDARMKITDVLRGADLLDSTSRQLALIQVLNYQIPKYWHVPLVTDAKGKRLAKRDGSDSLMQLRKQGRSRAEILKLMFDGLSGTDNTNYESAQTILDSWSLDELVTSLRCYSRV